LKAYLEPQFEQWLGKALIKKSLQFDKFLMFCLCFQVLFTGIYSQMTFFIYLFSFSLQSSIIMSMVQLALLGGTSLLNSHCMLFYLFLYFFSLARTSQCCHLRVIATPQVEGQTAPAQSLMK
jgi:hypothetical protein